MSFQEALDMLSREERFKATVYAMNSLLIQKGVYAPEEFEQMFKERAEKERVRPDAANGPHLPAPTLYFFFLIARSSQLGHSHHFTQT